MFLPGATGTRSGGPAVMADSPPTKKAKSSEFQSDSNMS